MLKEAIQKAIEGGYGYRNYIPKDAPDDFVKIPYKEMADIFLDPLFWQALGKAMGWEKMLEDRKWGDKGEVPDPMWLRKWHRFIDHLAEGKDAESFFEALLK